VDVANRDDVFAAVTKILNIEGRIDALVAAAAIQPRTTIVEMDPAEWQRVIDVNLNGVMWATQAVLPAMIEAKGGAILAFSSGLANVGHPGASAYAATKGALVPWIKSLAAEIAEHRITANIVFPGVIDTPQFRKANPAGGELEHWKNSLGVGEPEDVVGPLMFLLSDAATMTGSILTRERAFGVNPDE
jgi:NAD(P)-dependent dehydrogenase (short-subunit alcohol dehydrogenase family)